MPYTVKVHIKQNETKFKVVEKTVFKYANGGTWEELVLSPVGVTCTLLLTMGGSGTSGGLRLMDAYGNYAFVVVGIHNYSPWVNIAVDLQPGNTGVELHPTYYSAGSRSDVAIVPNFSTMNSKGISFSVEMKQQEGSIYTATIKIH